MRVNWREVLPDFPNQQISTFTLCSYGQLSWYVIISRNYAAYYLYHLFFFCPHSLT
jgi:hypothetical protein